MKKICFKKLVLLIIVLTFGGEEAIYAAVFSNFAIFEKENSFGELYRLDFTMTNAGKTATVRTGWLF